MGLTLLAAIIVGLFDPIAPPKNDAASIEGTWVLIAIQSRGKQDSEEYIRQADIRLIIEGERFTTTAERRSNPIITKGTIKLDPSKTPKAYDSMHDDGTQLKGIYSLTGDTLTLCIAAPGVERPTAFETKPGDRLTLATYKREPKR